MAAQPYADIWERVADIRGDAPAEVHGDRRISWRDFDRRADGIAQTLLDAGAVRQDKVANYLYNAPEYMEAFFGTVKAGLVPVNTNYRYGPDELTYLWDNADAIAVVFHGTFTSQVDQVRSRVPKVRLWLWVDDGSGPCPDWAVPYTQAAKAATDRVVAPWGRSLDDIIMIYTGGTTGMPKGVMWRQGDLGQDRRPANANETEDETSALPPPAVFLPACPLMHATALMTSLGNKRAGGTIVTVEGRTFDPIELLDTIDREHVASIAIVGDAFCKPVLGALDEHPGRWTLESLRVVISSGVMWSEASKQALLRHRPTLRLHDSLGSTEAPGLGSANSSEEEVSRTASFKAGPNTRVITDDGRFAEAGSGEVGMLGRSGSIPVGYYKDPEKSAATFRTIDGVRFTIPGDYATVDEDGTIHLLGRGSVCINTGGEKVFPEEVEEVLKEHASVHDAVVVGVPDETWGEAVVAVVEPAGSDGIDGVDEATLIEHVKARLARYKAPKRVLTVATIGRAPNGKVDYARLKREATAVL